MNKSTKRWTKVFMLLIVITVIGGCGYYIFNNYLSIKYAIVKPAVSKQVAEQKATELLIKKYPYMKGAEKSFNPDRNLPYWEFGYGKKIKAKISGTETVFTEIVIVTVDKQTGETSVITTN